MLRRGRSPGRPIRENAVDWAGFNGASSGLVQIWGTRHAIIFDVSVIKLRFLWHWSDGTGSSLLVGSLVVGTIITRVRLCAPPPQVFVQTRSIQFPHAVTVQSNWTWRRMEQFGASVSAGQAVPPYFEACGKIIKILLRDRVPFSTPPTGQLLQAVQAPARQFPQDTGDVEHASFFHQVQVSQAVSQSVSQ
eukprot:TRINITY_DN274_c3_g1_i10.p1 TRINITY_DN274_c3_g1~~TRINITY_DN274_c3_g1_i10.p1  ORF type:complete len:191 (-),score=10.32 TRINITY_DN274_c3_g1_i10:1228-1800(-)